MKKISKETLKDLEFDQIISQIESRCHSILGKNASREITTFLDIEELEIELKQVDEYLKSYSTENRIPNHDFEDITNDIKLLGIENTFLEEKSYLNIASVSETVNDLIKFLEKFKDHYPSLKLLSENVIFTKEITEAIFTVFNRFGELKDNATTTLHGIRKSMGEVRKNIDKNFQHALSRYSQSGYLDDIRESVIENKRVLAVKAEFRKKVDGNLMGSSRSGSIVFIEPNSVLNLTRELASLQYEEKKEVVRILKLLTNLLRPHKELLNNYLVLLVKLDVLRSKSVYAKEINACLPKINSDKKMELIDAYHPILFLNNKASKSETIPQSIKLTENQRIIVVSGPNAGGKSITLKTLGLIQVMLQSGILVPIDEKSTMCFFDKILTDIGDNQSIENHLSTYSYRLKNMNHFLRNVDKNTLFLIDEFGTGSDPELGGALAEVFLEEFYEKGAYGVITTHYTNIKVLVEEMPEAINANMLFNEKTLEPLFKLHVGQAGSSFTFEVAQKNGIPFRLINRAKKKVNTENVRLDKTIAKLQKERSKMETTNNSLVSKEIEASEKIKKYESISGKIADKLENYQEQFDTQAKTITLGKKLGSIIDEYFQKPNKKKLFTETLKIAEMENAKKRDQLKVNKESKKKQVAIVKKKEEVAKEMEEKIAVIREKKIEKKKAEAINPPKPKYTLKIGDTARITGSVSYGTIERIERKKATLNYGSFTTIVNLDRLELVNAAKR
ncbi:MAG: DNA mismatch repair protein MutS [Ichthyobacteriaceae bacterium]|nr:DNA mismatch repair protein MutS [Ichthyobacteriaceae bacterium]